MDTPGTIGKRTRRSAACDECKRRKVRCSAEPQCANCVKDNKNCNYSTPLQRVAILQRDVDNYEQLFASLRRSWAHHLPDVSLEQALAGDNGDFNASTNTRKDPLPQPAVGNLGLTATVSPSSSDATQPAAFADPGTPEQNNAEDYEFDESQDADRSIDGMGFMTAESRKSGYTGPQSGISALRFLRHLHLESSLAGNDASQGQDAWDAQTRSQQPSRSEVDVDSMINDYFGLFHSAYPLLHEGLFRARASGIVPKPRDGSWPLLYNMVIAMGAFVGDSGKSNTDLEYYRTARESISLSVLEKGSLCYVHGLVIMANYLQKRNKPNAGFALIGVAWSMALSIGLHREFGQSSTTIFTMELRRRTWWTLFIFVSGAQLTFGRPPVSLIGINIKLPLNVNDADLAVDMDYLPKESDGPTSTSCLIAQVKLANIANAIQAELLTNQVPSTENASRFDQRLLEWTAELPSFFSKILDSPKWFQQGKYVLLWRSHHLRIVLNRPYLFQAVAKDVELDFNNQHIQNCIQTADTCVDSICRFFETNADCRRGFAWYATYWLITASFVHATCLAYAPTHPSTQIWKFKVERAACLLGTLGRVHSMAKRAQHLLERLLNRFENSGFSQSSPQTQTLIDGNNLLGATNNLRNGAGGSSKPLDVNDEILQFDNPADLSWLWPQGLNAEFMDAAGGITLQNYDNVWD